jgi:hypothetical protein
MTEDEFMAAVRAELARARAKFPGRRLMALAMVEEAGELTKALLDEPRASVVKEAIQTAVMAARVALDGDESVDAWRKLKGLDALAGAPE